MSPRGIEIERKFRLRTAPAPDVLAVHGAFARRIEQVYLRPGSADGPAGDALGTARVRRTELPDGSTSFRRTTKRRVGAFAFDETEDEIDAAAWAAALERADPERRPIRKTRYVVPAGPHTLEIDVFEEPPDLVVVEVELESEADAVTLPDWLGEWREVTTDDRYYNASLARRDAEVPPYD